MLLYTAIAKGTAADTEEIHNPMCYCYAHMSDLVMFILFIHQAQGVVKIYPENRHTFAAVVYFKRHYLL